jgi:putative hydrolase of the HAD superfamily
MKNIRNIIFDLGGVIFNIDNNLTRKAFEDLGAKDFGNYFGHGFASSFFLDYETGKISTDEFVLEIQKLIGHHIPKESIIKAWDAMLLEFPPARIKLLDELSEDYRIFLFSNTNAQHKQTVDQIFRETFEGRELDELFEKAYYSNIMGMRKPDKEPFQLIVKENFLDPKETLFVDDALINVNGAHEAGIKGFYLPPGIEILDILW